MSNTALPKAEFSSTRAPRMSYNTKLMTMIIGACTIVIHLPGIFSLKEKRSIIKSVLARLRNEFNVSAAEVDAQDAHGRAVLGIACVSSSSAYARGQLEAVVRWVEEHRPDVAVIDHEIELL